MLKTNWQSKQIWILIMLLVVVFDQYTKILSSHYLDFHQFIAIVPGVKLMLAHNYGAAWSFLANQTGWQRWFLAGVAVLMSGILSVWIYKTRVTAVAEGISLSLILGGALGNLIDRLIFGYVIDFISLYYKAWHWPTFNIADAAITVGGVMLAIEVLKKKEETQEAVGI